MADDWQPELDELRRRETFAERLGGAEPVKRQHDEGRLTIRRRIARLVDPDTFHEVGKIAGTAAYDADNDLESLSPSNFIFGRARVDGREVPILQANYLFRAIRLPAGEHSVEFSYVPDSFRNGVIISALALVVAALLTAGGRGVE